MADIEHVDIPESGLHESKGISTAIDNTVYVANGAGSGSFRAYTPGTTSQVVVESLSDLPTPSGGVITLAANTQYLIAKQVDLGTNVIVYSSGSDLCGFNVTLSGLSTSSTSPLITATNVTLRVENMLLTNPLGDLFSFASNSASISFQILTCASLSFLNIGTFNTVSSGIIELCSFIGGVNGVTFTGTGVAGNVGILNSRFIGFSGTAVDLNTSVFDTISLNTVILSGLGGSTSLDGATGSANVVTRGTCVHSSFNGAGTAVAGITTTDLKWNFNENFGVENSHADAQGSITANATATTFSGTSSDGTNAVVVDFGVAFVSDLEDRFTTSTGGRHTYDGVRTSEFIVNASVFGEITGGAARQYNYYIAKNDVVIVSSISKNEYDGSNPGASFVSSVLELETGDYIELWVEAVTATTALTVETCNLGILSR